MEQYMPVKSGADGPDQEADDGLGGVVVGSRRHAVTREYDDREHHGDHADGLVLPLQECFRAFANGVRDHLHLGRAGVRRDDRPRHDKRNRQSQQRDPDRNPQVETSIVQIPCQGAGRTRLVHCECQDA
jgi:hypothetical protein